MKLLITDEMVAIGNYSNTDYLALKSFFTYSDDTKAMTANGYDSKKIKKVSYLVKSPKGVLLFRTGFLREFAIFCKKENLKIEEIKDNRTKYKFQKETDVEKVRSLFNPEFDYIEHQVRAVMAMLKTNVGVLKLPTSAGKSVIIEIFLKISKLPTLIIVDGVSLTAQLSGDLRAAGLDVGLCSGKGIVSGFHMVSTLGSVKKLELTEYECLIIDECHSAAARTYQEFLGMTNFPLRFGLSATPDAGGKWKWSTIRNFLGSVISETFAKELLENKVITPPKIIFKTVPCTPTDDWTAAYELNIVKNTARNMMAVNIVNDTDKPTLVLFKIIEHGEILSQELPDAILLSGKNSLKERQAAVDKFKSGEVKTLIASNIFKQGISISNIEVLINVSGGKSKIEVLQKIGRALRKSKGKKVAEIYDFHDTGNYFTKSHSEQREYLYKKAGFTDIIRE